MKKNDAGGDFCRLIRRKALDSAGIFKFGSAREEARELLRLSAARMEIPVLNYCILPGEMVILVDASSGKTASLAMSLFSTISKMHNARKRREGPCWKDRADVTLIRKNGFLEATLSAIDMLPVAGKLVRHPSEWACSGFQELAGIRRRYRIIDRENICRLSGFANYTDFSRQHLSHVESLLESGDIDRFPFDALAIGDEREMRRIANMLPGKLGEIRRCRIVGGLDAEAFFVSKKWRQSVSRSI